MQLENQVQLDSIAAKSTMKWPLANFPTCLQVRGTLHGVVCAFIEFARSADDSNRQADSEDEREEANERPPHFDPIA